MSGDILDCRDLGAGALGIHGKRPGFYKMPYSAEDSPPQQRLVQSKTSIVSLLRHPGLDCKHIMS